MPQFEEQFFSLPDGMRLRYGWFKPATPPRGTVLCVGGRREFIEKDLDVIKAWLARNFQVVALDLRGQGGSGRLLPNTNKSHVGCFDDYRSDIHEFYRAIIKPEQKGALIAFGHSMGAFILIDWLLAYRPDVRGAIFVTPMLAFPIATKFFWFINLISRGALWLGCKNAYVPGDKDFDAKQWQFANNVLTHDAARYRIIPDWFAKRPAFAMGGVTYGWLNTTLQSLRRVRKELKDLVVPILVLNAGADRVVLADEVNRWAQEIPNVTLKNYPGALHDLMCETDDYLAQVWHDIDAFVKRIIA